MDSNSVLQFWREAGPKAWFSKDDAFDDKIRATFGGLHEKAINHQLEDWRKESHAMLALILLIDQFSRNLNRNSAKAFANDAYGHELSMEAIEKKLDEDKQLSDIRFFFYLPLMHTETIPAQKLCLSKMEAIGHKEGIDAAITHMEIIERFGRFPHRNPVLGRETSLPEQEYLEKGGFSG